MKQKSKGFTLIELLIVIAIIGTLSVVILASLSKAGEKAKGVFEPSKQDKQEQTQNMCVKQGGIPILDRWENMTICQFKQETTLPPCNGSDLSTEIPRDIRNAIEDARRGACI